MAEIRTFKNIESKVHEELFNNLYLLNCIYKPSPTFDRVFKKDMFVKNNKAAFYEVVYYLLNILNPEMTKEKLTTWPPYEIKGETKFRSELLKYINELNHLYKNANIPPIMPSHLISPGGFKFIKFMLKLTQLVMFEHLKKKRAGLLLYNLVPNRDIDTTKGMLTNLNRITVEIENRTKIKLQKFQEYRNNQRDAANSLVNNLTELDKSISKSKKVLAAAEEDFCKKYTLYPSLSSLEEKLTAFKQQWNNLSNIHNLFEQCKNVMSHLSDDSLVQEHNLDIQRTSNTSHDNKIYLPEFFNMLSSLINSKSLEISNPTSCYIEHNTETVQQMKEKYIEIEKDIDFNKKQICNCIKDMFDSLKYVESIIKFQTHIDLQLDFSEESLGIKPLEDSLEY